MDNEDFQAGDIVTRRPGTGVINGYAPGDEFELISVGGDTGTDNTLGVHYLASLRLVRRHEPLAPWEAELLGGQRPFQVGDVVVDDDDDVHHTVARIDGTTLIMDDSCEWEAGTVTLVTAVDPNRIEVGDYVQRTYGGVNNDATFLVTRIEINHAFGDGIYYGTGSDWDRRQALRKVPAPGNLGGFNVGDIVRTRNSREDTTTVFMVEGPHSLSGDNSAAVSLKRVNRDGTLRDPATTWARVSALVLVTAVGTTPVVPRKLGETPAGTAIMPDGRAYDKLPITDPRIAWIWEDLGTYADKQNWCGDYDRLARGMGIPGRMEMWSGTYTVAGSRIAYDNIRAATRAEAITAHQAMLVAELTPAPSF